jgi:hypothetical protein
MFNAHKDILNTGSTHPQSRILKSYSIEGHKLVRPNYAQYREAFRKFSFYIVTPTFETQVVELPDLDREPDVNFLDMTRLETHRDDLRRWLFWLMCQSRKKKEKLADKAKHIAQLYLRISENPISTHLFFDDNDIPIASYASEYDPDCLATRYYCYQIALIAKESYWWSPKGSRCVGWAEGELIRMKHIAPDITYTQTEFDHTVVSTLGEKDEFNKIIEKALTPFFPKWVPLGGDFKAYPRKAPADIPRYAITREEFLQKTKNIGETSHD